MRDSRGRSCLHICLRHLKLSHYIESQLYRVKYLLDNKADPYACDKEGVYVSDIAYENRNSWAEDRRSSAVGDLWDSALHRPGYDIAGFRQQHQRKAKYTPWYTRRDFKTLWRGIGDGMVSLFRRPRREAQCLRRFITIFSFIVLTRF
ncbi:hypothetical protein F4824DRAFT_356249 [Ustulina deusta]|nr:hypothetical protein F4824DRAFT_356249 [Ustulina deusta]